MVGVIVGTALGIPVLGDRLGAPVGLVLGLLLVGIAVVGLTVLKLVGVAVGILLGKSVEGVRVVGFEVGAELAVGDPEVCGPTVGLAVAGFDVGLEEVGVLVGFWVGALVVGLAVGLSVSPDSVGLTVLGTEVGALDGAADKGVGAEVGEKDPLYLIEASGYQVINSPISLWICIGCTVHA